MDYFIEQTNKLHRSMRYFNITVFGISYEGEKKTKKTRVNLYVTMCASIPAVSLSILGRSSLIVQKYILNNESTCYSISFKRNSTHYKVRIDLKWRRHKRGFKFHKQKNSKAEFSHWTFSSVFTSEHNIRQRIFNMGDSLIHNITVSLSSFAA